MLYAASREDGYYLIILQPVQVPQHRIGASQAGIVLGTTGLAQTAQKEEAYLVATAGSSQVIVRAMRGGRGLSSAVY
mgnify:CR=1 FL=1